METQGQDAIALALAAGVTLAGIFVLRRVAVLVGWVDRPSGRKQHIGEIPLVGGVSMFVGIAVGVIYSAAGMTRFELALFGTALVLVAIGTIDDRFNLSARLRVVLQIFVILVMMEISGVYVHTLGTVFGHNLALGWLGIPFTVIAVAGIVNAFNMMDGLDGLCGCLGALPIACLMLRGTHSLGTLLLAGMLGAALIPYLAFNLGLFGSHRKIFMGDAGSMALGFIVAWSLIYASQGGGAAVMPATVLWFVAIPAMDAITIMASRALEGQSPFNPDRRHIQHVLRDAGLGRRQTLLVLVGAAIVLAVVGELLGRVSATADLLMFLAMFATYAGVRIVRWKKRSADRRTQVHNVTNHSPVPPSQAGIKAQPRQFRID